jgi:hypothetical protein
MNHSINKPQRISFFSRSRTSLLLFILSLCTFLYWFIGTAILKNVYQNAVVGAIYELLWLPRLLMLIATPIVSTLIIINPNSKKVLAILSILLTVASFVVLSRA